MILGLMMTFGITTSVSAGNSILGNNDACKMLDQNGEEVKIGLKTKIVPGDITKYICKSPKDLIPNDSGEKIVFNSKNFPNDCEIPRMGTADSWRQVIPVDGTSKLICKLDSSQ